MKTFRDLGTVGNMSAFGFGVAAAALGLLVLFHHVREPLAQSIHFAFYDWIIYAAYPGFLLASTCTDVFSPNHKLETLSLILVGNGLLFSVGWFMIARLLRFINKAAHGRQN